jgi:exodeoxyribonuclease VII large subunit
MIAETRARLAVEGLLDRPRRRVPRLPRVIGVLCGSEAAVRKDIESVVAARFPGYPLYVEETTVSGPGAALSIIDALRRLAGRPEVDVVVLARGGGDATALLPWSDEELCRTVAACPVPVVSAIGHESDRPLCDEVADLRCGTPSIAAHAVVPDRHRLEAELAGSIETAARSVDRHREMSGERLAHVEVGRALDAGRQRAFGRLQHAADRLEWAHPGPALQSSRRRLDRCDWRRPMAAQLQSSRGRAEALGRHARSLSPQHVIERGFAVVRRLDGTVVRRPEQVGRDEIVHITVARGRISARVEDSPVPENASSAPAGDSSAPAGDSSDRGGGPGGAEY